jgi:type VI secretion system secreted protein Hcp
MAVDYFLKIDGIPGESQDKAHKGEIDVISFSWNVSRQGPKARLTEFKLVKAVDTASPLLFQTACQCTTPGTASFVARKAGERPVEYLKITMKEVIITSVSPNSGTDLPLETVTLGFKSVEMQVASQNRDGTLGPYLTGSCDSGSCGGKDEGGH